MGSDYHSARKAFAWLDDDVGSVHLMLKAGRWLDEVEVRAL